MKSGEYGRLQLWQALNQEENEAAYFSYFNLPQCLSVLCTTLPGRIHHGMAMEPEAENKLGQSS